MATHKNKTFRFISTAVDIYFAKPMTYFGDSIISFSRLIASPIINPILDSMAIADEWQTKKDRASQILNEFQEAENRRLEKLESEVKSKAGKAGAIARWSNQSA